MLTFFYQKSGRLALVAGLCMMAVSVGAQSDNKSKPKTDNKLPAGTYYIVNVETGDAITPAMSSLGQNVFLKEFNRDGTQKWKVTAKGKKYTILLNGFNDLFFQPHPSVSDHTPIISLPSNGGDQFGIEATASGHWVIKNQNGNYLNAYHTSSDKEMRFGPASGGSRNHLWEFRPI